MISFFLEVSFFGVVAISFDRFLAIHLHLRYREFVTHKRVVVVVISIWLLSAFLSSMSLWSPIGVHFTIFITIGVTSRYSNSLFQDILFGFKMPQKPNKRPSSTVSGTEGLHGKFFVSSKFCCWSVLSLPLVLSLLLA